MRKLLCLIALCATSFASFAQVGVNTETPASTLDVVGDATDTSSLDGIIAPRLTGAELQAKTYTAAQTGAIVYATAADPAPAGQTVNVIAEGYYSFNGTVWIPFSSTGASTNNATMFVYVDTADPNSATQFDTVSFNSYDETTGICSPNLNFVNDPTLANNSNTLYIGETCTDGIGIEQFYWAYDGTSYNPTNAPESTPWFLGPTSNLGIDAGSNKDLPIRRDGGVRIGRFTASGTSNKLTVGHMTADDPTSNIVGGTLTAIQIDSDHAGTNDISTFRGISGTVALNGSDPLINLQGININTRGQEGSATINNLMGIRTNAQARGDRVNNISGIDNTVRSLSVSTTNANTVRGMVNNIDHAGANDVNTFEGIRVDGDITSTGSVNNVRGINSNILNNSTGTDLVSDTKGILNSITHSAPSRAVDFYGLEQAVILNEGHATDLRGITTVIRNTSTSTASMVEIRGNSTDITHDGLNRTTNLTTDFKRVNISGAASATSIFGDVVNINNNTTSNTTTQVLVGNRTFLTHDAPNRARLFFGDENQLNIQNGHAFDLRGNSTIIRNNTTSTNTTPNLRGDFLQINQNGANRVTTLVGQDTDINVNNAAGAATTIGNRIAIDNNTTANTTNLIGITNNISHQGNAQVDDVRGLNQNVNINNGTTNNVFGIDSDVSIGFNVIGSISTVYGKRNNVDVNGDVAIDNAYGNFTELDIAGNTGITNNAYGSRIELRNRTNTGAVNASSSGSSIVHLISGDATIDNMYGLNIQSELTGNAATATINNMYGILINTGTVNQGGNNTSITNQYGIFMTEINSATDRNIALSANAPINLRERDNFIAMGDYTNNEASTFFKGDDGLRGLHLNYNTISGDDGSSAFVQGGIDMGAIQFSPNVNGGSDNRFFRIRHAAGDGDAAGDAEVMNDILTLSKNGVLAVNRIELGTTTAAAGGNCNGQDGRIVFNGTDFFGCNGSNWVQLNN